MPRVPHVPGVLSEDQCDKTGAAIASMQEDSGAMPWFPGGQIDPWDHVESAMALSVTGRFAEAEAAYEWSRRTQRPDGSWPIKTVGGRVVDDNIDANFCAYIAVGVWHHYLISGDTTFLQRMWPTVFSAIELVVRFALPDGRFRWGGGYPLREAGGIYPDAMLTGSASIHQALGCAAAIADEMAQPSPPVNRGPAARWRNAQVRVGHALRAHPERFLPASDHSMDWYYPVLGGAVRGRAGEELIASRWAEFVVPDLGIRCVDHRPWVTGAETCELVLAMDALGDATDATTLFADMQHLRDPDGSYWTGLVFADGKRWPVEKSCWTSAAVVLAADALSRTTAGNGIFRDADPLHGVLVSAQDIPGLSCDCTFA